MPGGLKHLIVASSAVLFLWSAAFPGPALGQERAVMEDRSADGRITTEAVQTLSFADLERAPDVLARVFPLPDGGWGVSSPVFGGVVQRFDGRGVPSGTLVRPGEGPGEFGGHVLAVLGDEDRLWVVDPANARLSVFSDDLLLAGDRPLPGRPRLVAPRRSGPGVILTGFMPGDGTALPLGVLTLDESADAFGGAVESENPRVSLKGAAETSEGLWTVANSGGAVNLLAADDLSVRERWRLPGEELHEEAPRRPARGARPVAQLAGVTADEEILWVAFGVADSDWDPEVDLRRDGADAVMDTRILAVDPVARAVVGDLRLDPLCFPVSGNRFSCVDELAGEIRIVSLDVEGR